MSRKFLLPVALVVLAAVCFVWSYGQNTAAPRDLPTATVTLGNLSITAAVADSPESRSSGLMFRESLSEDGGMLFVLDSEGYWSFWMRNVRMPLDIIWINNDLVVVDVQSAVPCSGLVCPSYSPAAPAKYVLELNAGYADSHQIGKWDNVSMRFGT